MKVVLLSTYELGRQPFGLASPAAWLHAAGVEVACFDLSRQPLDEAAVRDAELVAFYLPMHTATRLAERAVKKVRALNPCARLGFYGLYAPMNESYLRGLGGEIILGGEFEEGLVRAVERLRAETPAAPNAGQPVVSRGRQDFLVPDRRGLPPLDRYAQVILPDGRRRVAGYTEASRGCKHLCRHCPVVPVYGGVFRVVPREVVLADIRQQVEAGAEHITFGDPDFFNGVGHALPLVEALHREFPRLSYDVTIKIEHLKQHAEHLATLRRTGCLFVTSAVESMDDRILRLLAKGHTRADFVEVAERCRAAGVELAPTFVPFTPWTTLEGYRDLLATLAELELIEQVAPIQLAIRLLLPAGSRLLELAELAPALGAFDPAALSYRWQHPDPRVDALQRRVEAVVCAGEQRGDSRPAIFDAIWDVAQQAEGEDAAPRLSLPPRVVRAAVPYLNEPWYC